ncbi:MAG: HAMP domain-containing histidine kinase [Clostridiales bacterium]|nr:HAMP domain-containing histidine kinase [Clostridiales bacterium]
MVNKNLKSGVFRKYCAVSMAVVLASLILFSTALMFLVSKLWLDEKSDLLADNTKFLAQNTQNTLESKLTKESERGTVAMICNSLRTISNAIGADSFIVDTKGDVIWCKEHLKENMEFYTEECILHDDLTVPPDILKVTNAGSNYRKTGNMNGILASHHIIVASPITINGKILGAVISTLPIIDGLMPYIITVLRMSVIAAALALLLCFIIVYFVSNRLTRPLRQMALATKQFAKGDFSAVIYTGRRGKKTNAFNEIDDLADSFNAMAKSLAGQELSRRSFVTNVSHELKTPMTTIGGFIDGILDGTISSENRDKYLKIVSDEVKRLSRLVTGMLNMSKIEAGEMEIKPQSFDISEMLFRTLLSFEQIINDKNIDVRGLDKMEANAVFADADMINQVIYNLVDNAVKFTPEGGFIEVVSSRDGEKAIVKIKNSGKGIEKEERDKIFERFYKVDKSRSFDVKGAGVGLFIVKTIVELHGGTISCLSEVDSYTEFIFTIPFNS